MLYFDAKMSLKNIGVKIHLSFYIRFKVLKTIFITFLVGKFSTEQNKI